MNYETFKEVVAEKFMDYMPEEYRGMKLKILTVNKVNVTVDVLHLEGEGDLTISPDICINDMYVYYQKTNDLQKVFQTAAQVMEQSMKEMPRAEEVVSKINSDTAKDNVVFQFVNTAQNTKMLADIPNRQFMDLSIIYYLVINNEKGHFERVIISNSMAEHMKLSEEQLFKLASENTRRIFPLVVEPLYNTMRKNYLRTGMPPILVDMLLGDLPKQLPLWTITNDHYINGAISMLYEDTLYDLAAKLETDLYIMPSSIHEVIAVPATIADPIELAEMVENINMHELCQNERLSNQVYLYDRTTRKISFATDIPIRRLDGVV